jgi:diguanylate cyclase (GGDEF)-like protein
MAFIMLDIDYFKELNDSQGHQAGDVCLTEVAKTIGQALHRPCDLAARYGGDEFIVLLPDSDLSGARGMAEKIRNGISGLKIDNTSSPLGKLTVSIGIASEMPEPDSHWKDASLAADKALYRAKSNGRNQIAE